MLVKHLKVDGNVIYFTTRLNHRVHIGYGLPFFSVFSPKWRWCSSTLRTNILTFTAQFESLWNFKLKLGTEFIFFLKNIVEISPSSAVSRSQGRREEYHLPFQEENPG